MTEEKLRHLIYDNFVDSPGGIAIKTDSGLRKISVSGLYTLCKMINERKE